MNNKDKIESIVKFVTSFPESNVSKTILRRYYLSRENYETSKELGIELKKILNKKENDELDFCYYLVK